MKATSTTGIFYGWKIVIALFIMLSFSSGLAFYNHTILLQALSKEIGFPIALASSAVSVFFLSSGLSGLAIARLLEKIDVRIIVILGAICASSALWLIGVVQSNIQLWLVYALFGIGFAASSLLPATTLIARWFHARRARALSIASTGLSFGGIVITPFCATLVENLGLSIATEWLALMYLCGVVPVALVLRSQPLDIGLNPDGELLGSDLPQQHSIGLASALKGRYFWLLSVSYLLLMLAQVGGIAHQYGLLSERLSLEQSRFAIALLPMSSIVGRLAGGWILEKIPTFGFTLVMMCMQGLSLLIMSISIEPWALMLGLIIFGITVGNLLMLQPLIIAEQYGPKDYAQIYSWSNLVTMFGVAGGPIIMGVMYANTGHYESAYITAAAMALIACVVFQFTRGGRIGILK